MLKFKDITLSDKSIIESFTRYAKLRNCDLSFANIYCWQPVFESAYAIVDEYLVIRFRIDGTGKIGYMQPIGCESLNNFSHLIPSLAADANALGQRLRLIGLPERCAARLRGDNFAVHSSRDFEDYIYLRDDLVNLRGKRYQPKRNHINQAHKNHTLRYTELTHDLFGLCISLDAKWRQENSQQNNIGEEQAIMRAFSHFEELGLRGGVLLEDGRVVAFTYGSAINNETFCIHIEKASRNVIGAYSLINKLFSESLPDNFTYVNREEDMGIEGLRRSKLSYYPHALEAKYTAMHLNHIEAECKSLWRYVFGDDDAFIDHFLTRYYNSHRMIHISNADDKLAAMLHIIPMTTPQGYKVAYIYGVATHPDSRNRGYASQLIERAITQITDECYDFALLIPSSETLFDYYTRFGFQRGECITISTPDMFDFGGDDPQLNISMIHPISPIQEPITELIYCEY